MRLTKAMLSFYMCGAAFIATPAMAQSDGPAAKNDSGQLGEIIVTARQRSEALIDVPVAVTAIGATEIQRTGVTDLSRLAQLAPQVILAQADSGTGASFSIRGLGTSYLDPGFDQSVIVNIDGAQISRGQIVLGSFFDLQQIEVLKGPQALFFGKNSPAGVVSISTANPTNQLSGYIRGGYEFEAHEKFIEAALSGPLTDTLKARLAVRGSDLRGWVKNIAVALPSPFPPAAATYFPVSAGRQYLYGPGSRDLAGRMTLVWTPTSEFSANLKVFGSKHKDNSTTTQQYCDPAVHNGPVSAGGVEDPSQNCLFDDNIASAGVPSQFITPAMIEGGFRADGRPYSKLDSALTVLNLNYKTDNLSLTSISTYLFLKYSQSANYDFTSYGLASSPISEKNNNFSQELRMVTSFDGPINLTLGAYYEKTRRNNTVDSLLVFLGPDPATGRYDTYANVNQARGRTLSGFGQVRWNIFDNLELAGGVRYTQERRTQSVANTYIHTFGQSLPAAGFVPVGQSLSASTKTTNWSPEATLTYKPSEQTMIYAAYKTGYKSGGFPTTNLFVNNPDGSPVSASQIGGARYAYDPEKANGGEVGFKAKLADNTIRIELTAYRYKYRDLQQSLFNAPTFSYIITNANARVQGVEFAAQWLATKRLRFNGAIAYNDAKYSRFDRAGCFTGQTAAEGCISDPASIPANYQNLTGRRLPRAPKLNVQGGVSYDTAVSQDWNVGLNTDFIYTSGYITQENQAPFALQKRYALLNAGIRLASADDHYEIALIGRNLTNKRYVQVSSSATFAATQDNLHASTPRGRELRLQGTYRF